MAAISLRGLGREEWSQRQRVLRTARLVLRPPRRMDADILASQLSDARVARMLIHVPLPYGRTDAAGWIASMRSGIRAGTARFYAIEHRSMIIGLAGLTGLNGRIAELGYWLGHPWWGRGFMSEAVPPVLRAAWKIPNLEAIEAAHMADNEASGRLLLRLGFRHTGTTKLYSWSRRMNVVCRTMLLDRPRSAQDVTAVTAHPAP